MEEINETNEINEQPEAEEILQKEVYTPRPKWQIIAAWVGVAVVAAGFALYCWHIATGGM
jgi:hypothetical protein